MNGELDIQRSEIIHITQQYIGPIQVAQIEVPFVTPRNSTWKLNESLIQDPRAFERIEHARSHPTHFMGIL